MFLEGAFHLHKSAFLCVQMPRIGMCNVHKGLLSAGRGLPSVPGQGSAYLYRGHSVREEFTLTCTRPPPMRRTFYLYRGLLVPRQGSLRCLKGPVRYMTSEASFMCGGPSYLTCCLEGGPRVWAEVSYLAWEPPVRAGPSILVAASRLEGGPPVWEVGLSSGRRASRLGWDLMSGLRNLPSGRREFKSGLGASCLG